jgi:hypothetical protein
MSSKGGEIARNNYLSALGDSVCPFTAEGVRRRK